jgi:hypothetical protein
MQTIADGYLKFGVISSEINQARTGVNPVTISFKKRSITPLQPPCLPAGRP